MTLEELIKLEKELRKKYGDDRYEQMYLHEKQVESISGAPNINTENIGSGVHTHTPQPPEFLKTAFKPADLKSKTDGKTSFENNTKSGIISYKPKSIEEFRDEIVRLSKLIGGINKQQYDYMLMGAHEKLPRWTMNYGKQRKYGTG